MIIQLKLAEERHLNQVLEFVRAYHALEGVEQSDAEAAAAIRPLLHNSALGRLWLICHNSKPIGYVVLCFGYSIEFSGRDAFVDEMFIVPEHRGQGYGKAVLGLVKAEAASQGVGALHLEVDHSNERAQRLYRAAGFAPRDRFFLMSARLQATADQEGAAPDAKNA